MYKILLKIFIVLALVFGAYKAVTIAENIKTLKDNITISANTEKTLNSSEKNNPSDSQLSDTNKSKENSVSDSESLSKLDNNNIAINNVTNDPDAIDASSNNNPDDYTVAVSSSLYNAIVLLDKSNKEVNIKMVDKSVVEESNTDRYINLSDEDIKYLLSNSTTLVNEFKSGNLLEKYDMIKLMLNKYDTDIKESDLISLAFAYLY